MGKLHQDLDTFRMPVDVRVDTEGHPETKKVLVTGTTSAFVLETFGRPKPNGILVDPNNNLLKSSPRLRVRASVARGESQAGVGKYYEGDPGISSVRWTCSPAYSLAHFRDGRGYVLPEELSGGRQRLSRSSGGDLDPKWLEVWSHIYMGKIYDVLGQRERAVNEYSLAQHTNDDTAGAQREAGHYLQTSLQRGQ